MHSAAACWLSVTCSQVVSVISVVSVSHSHPLETVHEWGAIDKILNEATVCTASAP